MQERFTSIDENPGENRCPRCGMLQTSFDDSPGQTVLHATCRICDSPLPSCGDRVGDAHRGSRRGSLRGSLQGSLQGSLRGAHQDAHRSSYQGTPQIQWHDWMETRRLERWMWFLFVIGLVTAGVIGLLRS